MGVRVADLGSPPDLPRAERLAHILERDGSECVWCRRPLALDDRNLSVDHLIPRLKGGPAWLENELAACRPCNRARGHTAPAAWLEACKAQGLSPNREAVTRGLVAVRDAIAVRGGQRRARRYLESQLRRLGV